MMRSIRAMLAIACLAAALPAHAALRILATTSDWGALATELGGDKVNVYTATNAFQDVHRVDAKPSLIARARSADLVVATGAELEIGWLPVLIQESGNSRIQPGAPGYFEAATQVQLLDKPSRVDRSLGDIHPQVGREQAGVDREHRPGLPAHRPGDHLPGRHGGPLDPAPDPLSRPASEGRERTARGPRRVPPQRRLDTATPPENAESCSSNVLMLDFWGMSNAIVPVTLLPGLMSLRNVESTWFRYMSASLSASSLLPCLS